MYVARTSWMARHFCAFCAKNDWDEHDGWMFKRPCWLPYWKIFISLHCTGCWPILLVLTRGGCWPWKLKILQILCSAFFHHPTWKKSLVIDSIEALAITKDLLILCDLVVPSPWPRPAGATQGTASWFFQDLTVMPRGIHTLGGGFILFLFSPLLGEMIQFDSCFSDELKPPTSTCLISWVF